MNLVSIIMPFYKKKKYILNSIKSILNQTYKNFEIIIIYDDSNLDDLKYILEIKRLDKRIRVFRNKENKGVGLSRNYGIKKSRGKFIAFLDADDIWHPLKLSTQIEFMIKNNFSITHTSYNIINEKNKKVGTRFAKNLKFSDLIRSCDVGLSTVIIDKKLLDNLCFPNLKTKEDYVLWLRLSKRGVIFYSLKKPLTNWKNTPNSLSKSVYQKLKDAISVYKDYVKMSLSRSIIQTLILSTNFLIKK